jgi:hypothetical protein
MWRLSEKLLTITVTLCLVNAILQVDGVRVQQSQGKQQAKKLKGECFASISKCLNCAFHFQKK